MSLFAELRRRNVIRMAGLYLVGAWLLVQVAGTVLPMFDVPDWVARAMVIVLALGFIPALVFAWIFELTPDGLKRDGDVAANDSIAPVTARRMDRMLLVGAFAVVAVLLVERFWSAPSTDDASAASAAPVSATDGVPPSPAAPDATAAANAASIAVLPFVNMSADAENGYFADGISEELLNVLAGIDGLTVASRTSSFTFRDGKTPIPQIATALGVQHVLEGSVRRQGQRVRITAQLIRAGTDAHLWSQTYDRDVTDIFAVQEEIAQAIADEMKGLLPVAAKVAVAQTTGDMAAYERFLRGRARFHQRRELAAGLEDLEVAVERDPAFAEAWVYLAATYYIIPGYVADRSEQATAEPLQAALLRAHSLAPAHPMLAAMEGAMLADSGDVAGGIDRLAEASARPSTDTTPTIWHGLVLLQAGYARQSREVLGRAVLADPLSGIANGYLGIAQVASGDGAAGARSTQRAADLGWIAGELVRALDLAAGGDREAAHRIFGAVRPSDDADFADGVRRFREALVDPAKRADYIADSDGVDEFLLGIDAKDELLDAWLAVSDDPWRRRDTRWSLRAMWLPSTRAAREDPRFFALARKFGFVALWEARGWPDGCTRVVDGAERLECGP